MTCEAGGCLEMETLAIIWVDIVWPHSQAKSLFTDRIQVRKRNQCVVWDIFPILYSGLPNFMAQFGLNVLMLAKEVEYPR